VGYAGLPLFLSIPCFVASVILIVHSIRMHIAAARANGKEKRWISAIRDLAHHSTVRGSILTTAGNNASMQSLQSSQARSSYRPQGGARRSRSHLSLPPITPAQSQSNLPPVPESKSMIKTIMKRPRALFIVNPSSSSSSERSPEVYVHLASPKPVFTPSYGSPCSATKEFMKGPFFEDGFGYGDILIIQNYDSQDQKEVSTASEEGDFIAGSSQDVEKLAVPSRPDGMRYLTVAYHYAHRVCSVHLAPRSKLACKQPLNKTSAVPDNWRTSQTGEVVRKPSACQLSRCSCKLLISSYNWPRLMSYSGVPVRTSMPFKG
jgi:hypothetical protein